MRSMFYGTSAKRVCKKRKLSLGLSVVGMVWIQGSKSVANYIWAGFRHLPAGPGGRG